MQTISRLPVYRKSFFQSVRRGFRKARVVGSPAEGYSLAVDNSDNSLVIVSETMPTRGAVESFCRKKTGRAPVVRTVKAS